MKKEKQLSPFSQAVKARKEGLYDKVKLSLRTLDVIIWGAGIALAIVVVLMILEATGIFKL
ncbi:MAG: hypothetical protein IJ461_08780 [Clostridia bacterium]|nr:hypothetical protein [Clostridia bacterium]